MGNYTVYQQTKTELTPKALSVDYFSTISSVRLYLFDKVPIGLSKHTPTMRPQLPKVGRQMFELKTNIRCIKNNSIAF